MSIIARFANASDGAVVLSILPAGVGAVFLEIDQATPFYRAIQPVTDNLP